ncbi:uncharacterized protein LOC144351973 [Saccoglossus kowalevskii]
MSVTFNRVIFLSDSVIAYCWIRGQSRQYKSFVANRVSEIQSQTDPSDWRHIPGEFNIADKISRGINVNSLVGDWKNGPAFLLLPEAEWPKSVPKAEHVHEQGHYGVATTAAKVRSEYWVVGVTRLAKTIKYRCVTCRILKRETETQFKANLPVERMAPFTPPFYFTASDYFGPYIVKIGRNKTTKHCGVIFTCMNTRAVDCSTMEFLQVLRRFFAIRGRPKSIQIDNGTQFVGAERQLREMVKRWSETKILCRATGDM